MKQVHLPFRKLKADMRVVFKIRRHIFRGVTESRQGDRWLVTTEDGYKLMSHRQYWCVLEPDESFIKWWNENKERFEARLDVVLARQRRLIYDVAMKAWEAARPCDSTEHILALAILSDDDAALPALVDRLIELGRLPAQVSPNGKAIQYRQALESCLDACREWGAGMDNIYEFVAARELLEED